MTCVPRVWRGAEPDPGEPQHGFPRVGICQDEEPLLAALADGATVLEIGTGLGYSTCAMARTAQQVITVDPDPWVRRTIVPALPPNVRHQATLPAPIPVDMAFIDGDHRPAAVQRDTALAVRCVRVGGLIVFHDWAGADDVANSVRAVVGDAAPLYAVTSCYGMGIMVVTAALRRRVYAGGG